MLAKTAAEIADRITEKRAHLAALATDGAPVRDLTFTVNEIAYYEGAHTVFATVERMADLDADERMEVVTDMLVRGADDQWSGRANDANRAHYDGVRETAALVLRRLRAEQ